MFEYLPQISEDVFRETMLKHMTERRNQLSRNEGMEDIAHELAQLVQTNKGVGKGVVAAVDSAFLFPAAFIDRYGGEEVKDFWGTVSPLMRMLIIEGVLLLLRGIDQALWAREMSKQANGEGT